MIGVCMAVMGASGYADEAPRVDFQKLTPEQRVLWVHGAISLSSHLMGLYDKEKSDCVARWGLRGDQDAKQKLIKDTLAKFPGELPTTVILALLTHACGPLGPK